MGLECESDPTSPFELKEPNTCVLMCEGLEKATLTCQLNDQEIFKKCISINIFTKRSTYTCMGYCYGP